MSVAQFALVALAFAAGCGQSHGGPDAHVGDAGPSAGEDAGPWERSNDLDLLLMVDDSNCVLNDQTAFAQSVERLVEALASGDVDRDGSPEHEAFTSVQVGIVTSDMGTGGHDVPTCRNASFGRDGVLSTAGRGDIDGCEPSYSPIAALGEDTEELSRRLACATSVGSQGCGVEQVLESPLKALSPARPASWTHPTYEPPVFFGETRGHGDGVNAGFVRDDSLLAIVVLSDEDDCSIADPALFDLDDGPYSAQPQNRCFEHPEALHDVERFVDGYLALRVHPSRLAFFVVGGIPLDLLPGPFEAPSWDRLGADERMQLRRAPAPDDEAFLASCSPTHGVSFAPVRTVAVARALEQRGARVGLGSTCTDQWDDNIDALARTLLR